MAPTAIRESRSAFRTRTWMLRITHTIGGTITAATSVMAGLRTIMPAPTVTSFTRLATSTATPEENTVSSVSTSAVQRLMTSPSGVRSKYAVGSRWRCAKRRTRRRLSTPWAIVAAR